MLDPYGRKRYGQEESEDIPFPYIVDDKGDGTTYTCFFDGTNKKVGIQKEVVVISNSSTVTTTTFAYDKWGNRENATYVPINDCWTFE